MTPSRNILEGLNPAQREAVETTEGPLLIVAGPGSGKTRVITHRVAYLIGAYGTPPYRILAVTFTNRAAREMRERLDRLAGPEAQQVHMSTFHSFCVRVLRRDGHRIGLDSGFTIYDDDDQGSMLKEAIETADLSSKQFPRRAVQAVISKAKSSMIDPQALARNPASYFEERVSRAYQRYEELLARNNAVDFDDLLLKAVQLFRSDADALQRYQAFYQYVMIDEFQDTNVVQYQLAKQVAGGHRNICVVGDPDQSIYSWRNADIRNILSFQNDYPEAKIVNLVENYRSTGNILAAAQGVIAGNLMSLRKPLRTSRGDGVPIIVAEAHTAEEEADFVVGQVNRLQKEENTPARDCAVMYRVNAQSRLLEEACLRRGMHYRLVGGIRFYQRKEVKDLMCYLRLLANPNDTVSLRRVINIPPRGFGQRSLEDLERWAGHQDASLFNAIQRMANDEVASPLGARATSTLRAFHHLVHELAGLSREVDVVELLDTLLERTKYRDYLHEKVEHPEERWENVMELRAVAQEFQDLDPPEGLMSLLERFALVADVDNYEEGDEGLTLITLHQAKGLEFPVVFLVGMEDGMLPHIRSFDDEAQMAEERRLCYVGITRAKERVFLVRSFRRGRNYNGGGPSIPSRFLQDIPRDLVQAPERPASSAGGNLGRSPWGQWAPSESSEPELDLKPGDKVLHKMFGEGMVINTVVVNGDVQATVAFDEKTGVKKLLLGMAPLQKL